MRQDLAGAGQNALVVAGQRQPIEVHLLAYAINSALGAIGNTVTLVPTEGNAVENIKDFNIGAIDTAIILGGNPAYHLNGSAKQKPKTIVRLGYYEDETAEISDWNFPATHYLESWGDATTSDGALVPIQPLIQPLFGGMTELEFLARIAGESQTNPHEIVQATFGRSEEDWKKFLFNGFFNSATGLQAGRGFKNTFTGFTPQNAPTPSSSKSFSIAIPKWTTVVTRTMAGCRNCLIPSRS
ncbi:MAG: hypothetical protein WDM76_14605 [Limisphaerales bacterium]